MQAYRIIFRRRGFWFPQGFSGYMIANAENADEDDRELVVIAYVQLNYSGISLGYKFSALNKIRDKRWQIENLVRLSAVTFDKRIEKEKSN